MSASDGTGPERSVYGASVYLLSRVGNSNSRKVHAAAGSDSDRPLCEHMGLPGGNSGADYSRKDAEVIPDGYYPECSNCRRALGSLPEGWSP